MIFKKYHVVVFKDGVGRCSRLNLRGGILFGLFFLVFSLAAANLYLLRYYHEYTAAERLLSDSEKTVQEQKVQMLSLASKLKTLEKDMTRIRSFDSKVRVMMNLDQGRSQGVSPIGGPEPTDFSKNYLTLYRQEMLARKMHNFLNQLSTDARLEEVRQQEILDTIRVRQDRLASTPSIWPTEGWVTADFGYRISPFTGRHEFHKGLDISAPRGTPIYAPAAGKVISNGHDGSYGLMVTLDHGSGYQTVFAHLSQASVRPGQPLARGELVGYVGSTGRSTGPHLHYEVRLNGVPVNPVRYILN